MITTILQYAGCSLALLGAWLVGSRHRAQRRRGFVVWVASNLVLLVWSIVMWLPGMGCMYLAFLITSIRGWASSLPVPNEAPAAAPDAYEDSTHTSEGRP